MRHLQKTWVRILVSLFGGGMISELIHISAGDPNRPTDPEQNAFIVFGSAMIIYFLLTNIAKKNK